ncbi:MAG: glycosyltransferase, partial [Calditrichaeota bacterium]
WLAWQLWREHRRQPFCLVHGIWHVGSLAAALVGRALHLPVVLSMFGGEAVSIPELNYGIISRPLWRWLLRRSFASAHVITAGSHYYVEHLQRFAPNCSHKIQFAPLGIDPQKIKPAALEVCRPVRLLNVAALQPVKNLPAVLEAMQRVNGAPVNLTIAGTGPLYPQIRQEITRRGLERKVNLRGWQSSHTFKQQYADYDLLVSSSRHEAQGMAMIEAAAAGLPILAYPVGAARELQQLGAAVVLIENNVDISEKIDYCLQNLISMKKRALAARSQILKAYALQNTVKSFARAYEIAQQSDHAPANWYEAQLPLATKVLRWVRPLVFLACVPFIQHQRKKNAPTRVAGLTLHTSLDVFHPKFFFSSKLLGEYVSRMSLQGKRFLDMGTGSGIVGIFAARKGADVTAVDINPAAVRLAARNAQLNGVAARMHCLCSDLFSELPPGETFDVIAFNPPFYAKTPQTLPQAAFFGGKHHEVLQQFIAEAGHFLAPGGRLVFILSSDMPLKEIHQSFLTAGLKVVSHRVKKHYFELFHLLELAVH